MIVVQKVASARFPQALPFLFGACNLLNWPIPYTNLHFNAFIVFLISNQQNVIKKYNKNENKND